jgi:hypothetical protein
MPTAAPEARHVAVLGLLDWLPVEADADAVLVAALLNVLEAVAAQLLADLEAAGYVTSTMGWCSKPHGSANYLRSIALAFVKLVKHWPLAVFVGFPLGRIRVGP